MAIFKDSLRSGGLVQGPLQVRPRTATEIPFDIQGVTGQTAVLFRIRNVAGTELFSVDNNGNVTYVGDETIADALTVQGNITGNGNLTIAGNTTLGDAAADALTVNATSTFVGPVTIGSLTATSAVLTSSQVTGSASVGTNLVVGATTSTQGLAVTGIANFYGAVTFAVAPTFSGGLFITDDDYVAFGNTSASPDVRLGWNTTQTVDGLFLGLSDAQNTFVIAENGDRAFDFAHGAQTNPFLFIHSAAQNTTQWIGFSHNQTNGIIQTGTGDLLLDISGGNLAPTTNGGSSLGISGGNTFANLYLASGGSIDWGGGDVIIANASNTISIGGALIHNLNQANASTGNFTGFTFAGGTHTGLTASTEATDINFNLARTVTFATGALTTQRAFRVQAPTYDFALASNLTTAVTMEIGGVPAEGANATIATAIALRIASNASTAANTYGLYVTASTGGTTANYSGFFSGVKDSATNPANGALVVADTAAVAAGVGGVILFQGNYTGTTLTNGAAIHTAKTNATDGQFGFDLAFGTRENGGNIVEKFRIGTLGSNVFTQSVNTSGVPTFMTFTAAAHTGLTAATEDIGMNLNFSATKTWAAGAGPLATHREVLIQAPTYAGDAGGALTITDAYTLYVNGGPTQGTNMTLTRSWAAGFLGNVGFAAGTVSLPSIAFNLDPDTGIFNGAANTLNFATAGAQRIGLSATAATFVVPLWSSDGVATSLTLQNQTFTSGVAHNAVTISPTWTAENFNHYALNITGTQNGDNTQYLAGLNITLAKATAATTLTSAAAIQINNLTLTAGSVNTQYGLLVNSLSGAINNYGIYSGANSHYFVFGAGHNMTFDAKATDHTGANVLSVLLDVNSASVSGLAFDVDVPTNALSAGEIVNAIAIDVDGNAGDNATSFINGIALTSANTSGGTTVGINYSATGIWDVGAIIQGSAFLLDLNIGAPSYVNNQGAIDIVRSGNFTGVDTQTSIDFNVAPAFTLTEPAGGTFTLYGVNIDLSGISVTAGVGTTVLAALRLVANADADVGTNLALLVDDGNTRFDSYNSMGMGASPTNGVVLFAGANATTMPAGTTAWRDLQTGGNVTELAGAAITDIVGAYFNTFTVTDGGGAETVGILSTVYISNAPTAGTAPSNGPYALFVDAGTSRFDGDIDLDTGTGLIRHNVTAGITASTTQTQGNGALTAEVNEVSVVANPNDTVTLPSAVAGYRVVIINNGANTLRIFPASGDNLGAGADTATTLASGSNVVYQAYDVTNWESI